MTYEIPTQLRKYAARFLVFDFRTDVTGLVFIFFAMVVFLRLPFTPTINGSAAVLVLVLGIIFIAIKADRKLINYWNYRQSLHNTSYYDSMMNRFIDISHVKDDLVFLKSGTLIGILKVKPLDFTILNKDEQTKIINAYLKFLRSLDYPIQICSRSVEVNLNLWLHNLEKGMRERSAKEIYQKEFFSFRDWILNRMQEGRIRNRVFYVVIPYTPYGRIPLKDTFKSLFSKETTVSLLDVEKSMKELNDRLDDAIDKLNACNVEVARLNSNELLSLFGSYFYDTSEVNLSYMSPLTWPK